MKNCNFTDEKEGIRRIGKGMDDFISDVFFRPLLLIPIIILIILILS